MKLYEVNRKSVMNEMCSFFDCPDAAEQTAWTMGGFRKDAVVDISDPKVYYNAGLAICNMEDDDIRCCFNLTYHGYFRKILGKGLAPNNEWRLKLEQAAAQEFEYREIYRTINGHRRYLEVQREGVRVVVRVPSDGDVDYDAIVKKAHYLLLKYFNERYTREYCTVDRVVARFIREKSRCIPGILDISVDDAASATHLIDREEDYSVYYLGRLITFSDTNHTTLGMFDLLETLHSELDADHIRNNLEGILHQAIINLKNDD